MGVRRRFWWIVSTVLGLLVIGVLIFAVYYLNWMWAGFTSKTLWDWMQLLIVPAVLAIGAFLFNLATTQSAQNIALDKQREDLFQAYLDHMSELLVTGNLRSSPVDADGRILLRARTITILFQLDPRRLSYVFAFLRESGLMSQSPDSNIVSLYGADLRQINFSQADLHQANLSRTFLFRANFKEAYLQGTNFSGANLSGANFTGANLQGANFTGADLRLANFTGADLQSATFKEAHLSPTKLNRANLSGANFSGADLTGALLKKANLSGAMLNAAKLEKTVLTKEQLAQTQLPSPIFQSFDDMISGQ